MSKAKNTVTFWQQLNGTVVAQKDNLFFQFPAASTVMIMNDKSMRQNVAKNFDNAPLKTDSFELIGAVILDKIEI
jgi:hypothetical protein